MFSLKATIRDKQEKSDQIRVQGFLPCVLYGEGIKNLSLKVLTKDFERVLAEAGESSLISLEADAKKFDVLIHDISHNPLDGKFSHIDFYHPSISKKVEVEVNLVFKGVSPAEKDLGGILAKEIHSLEIKGLVKDLPKEIVVDVSVLDTLHSRILVKDLNLPKNIEVAKKHPEEIVAHILEPKEEKEEKVVAVAGEVKVEGGEKDGAAENKS